MRSHSRQRLPKLDILQLQFFKPVTTCSYPHHFQRPTPAQKMDYHVKTRISRKTNFALGNLNLLCAAFCEATTAPGKSMYFCDCLANMRLLRWHLHQNVFLCLLFFHPFCTTDFCWSTVPRQILIFLSRQIQMFLQNQMAARTRLHCRPHKHTSQHSLAADLAIDRGMHRPDTRFRHQNHLPHPEGKKGNSQQRGRFGPELALAATSASSKWVFSCVCLGGWGFYSVREPGLQLFG